MNNQITSVFTVVGVRRLFLKLLVYDLNGS